MNPKEKLKAEETIRAVAKQNGVSAAEVRKEMSIAVAEAYKRAKAMNDPAWNMWTRQPTPEEFIIWVSKKLPQNNYS